MYVLWRTILVNSFSPVTQHFALMSLRSPNTIYFILTIVSITRECKAHCVRKGDELLGNVGTYFHCGLWWHGSGPISSYSETNGLTSVPRDRFHVSAGLSFGTTIVPSPLPILELCSICFTSRFLMGDIRQVFQSAAFCAHRFFLIRRSYSNNCMLFNYNCLIDLQISRTLASLHRETGENLSSTSCWTPRAVHKALQQLLAKSIEVGSVEERGLRRVVDIKVGRIYLRNNKTGSTSTQYFAVTERYPELISIVPTLIWQLQQALHINNIQHQTTKPPVLYVRRTRRLA